MQPSSMRRFIRLFPKSPVAQAYREVAAEVALLRSA